MSTIQQLVDQLSTAGGQWKIVGGGTPVEETAPIAVPADAANLTPATTVNRGTGRYYVTVQDAEGHQRALFLKPDPITNTIAGGRSDVVVRQSGVNDEDESKVYSGDLGKLSWSSGGPVGDVPQGAKTPSATNKLDLINSAGKVIPADQVDVTKPETKPVQSRDSATGTTFNLVTDPAGTLHDLGNDVILVKPDGSYTKVATKPKEPTQINVPGVGLVDYDPNKDEGSRASVLIKAPAPNDPKTSVVNGVTYQYDPDTKGWIKTDLPAQQDIGYTFNDPNSRTIKFFDKQGKQVGTADKGDDWKPPVQVQPGTAPAADLVSPNIPTFNPQTGALEFTPNQNQIKSSDATAELAKQLGVKVAAGSMSEKQAQDIITGAINTMNAQTSRMTAEASQQQGVTTAAGDILANTRANAQTGAGLLQQRVQAATGALTSILGSALGNKNFGAAGNLDPNIGTNLVQGLQSWTADLMGGQSTLDSAAHLVQMADPSSNMHDPNTQTAIAALSQMLDKYQELNGGVPHPAHAQAQASLQSAAASTQNGGMTAPQTWNRNDIQWNQPPQNAPGRVMGPGGVISGGVPATQAVQAVAPVAAVPGQNYTAAQAYTGGIYPWNAQPGMPAFPGFIAPGAQPTLASSG